VSEDIGDLKGVVDLHSVVDADSAVLIEVAAGFLASGEHNGNITWKRAMILAFIYMK
jgi:hypothetical protein